MGTRHLICVILDGKHRVAQYGQFDGYLGGVGVEVADFIHNNDMERFKERIKNTKYLSVAEINKVKENFGIDTSKNGIPMDQYNAFGKQFPAFVRETSSDILHLIMDGTITQLEDTYDFGYDGLFCEFCYIINLDSNELEIYFGNNGRLKKTERFYTKAPQRSHDKKTIYYPVKMHKSIPFADCSVNTIKLLEKELNPSS
jgi:hypothetical protein